MILQKIAYITNWIIIVIGFLFYVPFLLPDNISENIYIYSSGFLYAFYIFVFVLMFGLFASVLALILQVRHLIILSLMLFVSPFLLIASLLLFY